MHAPDLATSARRLGVAASIAALGACTDNDRPGAGGWGGTIDTLPSGQVAVTNPERPLDPTRGDADGWSVVEELRIGSIDDPGPYGFGRISELDVDRLGRIWVLEPQAGEIRVFDDAGRHVRTVGRQGGGPGEFNGPAHIEFGPDGRLWVPDPRNNRVSVIDTTGAFVHSHRTEGGFFIAPWPGGFDTEGFYYHPVPHRGPDGGFGIATVRYDVSRPDAGLVPIDTIPRLSNPFEIEVFELTDGDGNRTMASVPFTPGFRSQRSPFATWWGLLTAEYRFFEVDRGGDTLRTVTTPYEPIPVTPSDLAAAREDLRWFTEQGGTIDIDRIPTRKPAAWKLFVDDRGRIWVDRVTDRPQGQVFDVFDPEGRFLSRVVLPVPFPDVRRVVGDYIYGVTHDGLGVPYVVRARLGAAAEAADG